MRDDLALRFAGPIRNDRGAKSCDCAAAPDLACQPANQVRFLHVVVASGRHLNDCVLDSVSLAEIEVIAGQGDAQVQLKLAKAQANATLVLQNVTLSRVCGTRCSWVTCRL